RARGLLHHGAGLGRAGQRPAGRDHEHVHPALLPAEGAGAGAGGLCAHGQGAAGQRAPP
ncbi:unnamed protein product, partial [Heterosigma akashiwo]